MRLTLGLILLVTGAFADTTRDSAAAVSGATSYPTYTADSIVHAATQTVEALAPNTIATLYGTNLAFSTRGVVTSDISAGNLPQTLDGVTVVVGNLIANLFYISPGQINFLVPYNLTAGTVTVYVARQGAAGPLVKIQLNSAAPGLFQWNGNLAIATHLDGSLISTGSPAKAGEIIILYAAGLGRVAPDTTPGRISLSAATIVAAAQMQILLAGVACPASNVLYAGLAPGFAGLYQINVKLPDKLPSNPEIRIAIGTQISPPLIQLSVQ